MPRTINLYYGPREVATEDELLDFCNAIREAGGANVLDALLPSEPSNAQACLIANNLNFGCAVRPSGKAVYEDGRNVGNGWRMHVSDKTTPEQRDAIAQAISERGPDASFVPVTERLTTWNDDLKMYTWTGEEKLIEYAIDLPDYIGNAADAFDNRKAFVDFIAEDFR